MWESIFYWTGLTVWVSIGCSIGFVLALIVRLIVIATWHLALIYRHGWLAIPNENWFLAITRPMRVWFWIFKEQPKYLERKDNRGGRIYRPGAKRAA